MVDVQQAPGHLALVEGDEGKAGMMVDGDREATGTGFDTFAVGRGLAHTLRLNWGLCLPLRYYHTRRVTLDSRCALMALRNG